MKKFPITILIIVGLIVSITVAAYNVSLNPSDTYQMVICENENGSHSNFDMTINSDRDSVVDVVIYCAESLTGRPVGGIIVGEDYNGWPVGEQSFEAWPGIFNGSGRKEFSQKPDNWPYTWQFQIFFTDPPMGYKAEAYFIWRTAF